MMMNPSQPSKILQFRIPASAVEALQQVRTSYGESVAETPLLAADQAVQRVVEMALKNVAESQRTA